MQNIHMTAKTAQEQKDSKSHEESNEPEENIPLTPVTLSAEGRDDSSDSHPETVQKPYVPLKNLTPSNELTHVVIKDTLTKNELLRRTRLLNDFLSFILFSPEGQAIKDLKEQIKAFFSNHQQNKAELDILVQEADWLNTLPHEFFAKFTRENFNVVFEDLEKKLVGTVPVILYLPFFMPDPEQKSVGEWLKKNVSDTLLFETTYDPNLIGGCSFSYRGVTKDYSIHARIEANEQKIIQDLKGFKKVQQ